MVRQLKFRERLVAMAAIPILVVAVVAVGLLLFVGSSATRPYGLFALFGLAVAGGSAYLVGRSILTTIDELIVSASALAGSHRKLADGEIGASDIEPIASPSDDEIGRLVDAMNAVNVAAVEAAESHRGAVKEGLSNIVVNLARRSQSLLDRQVEYLDRLESTEEDPDRLAQLFKVDHLATRMRRNAESLLVLAEAEPGRRRGEPVEIADVLRVAIGEVENYQHIELRDVGDGQVSANVAVDIAHLVAELMENATQFSPPNTPVEVKGTFNDVKRFVVTITDQGMGLDEEKLAKTNALLASPPELGLGMGRSLGFMVIGRLAQRLGATVSLRANDGTGSTAVVDIPEELFIGHSLGDRPSLIEAMTGVSSNDDEAEADDDVPAADTDDDVPAGDDDDVPAGDITGQVQDDADDQSDEADDGAATDEEAATSARPAGADRRSQKGSVALEQLLGLSAESGDADDGDDEDATPVDWASTSPFESDSGDTDDDVWVPPKVTGAPPAKLAEAVPSGEAFESGVASLLEDRSAGTSGDSKSRTLRDDGATSAGLKKRERGASHVPVGEGRHVAATSRDPEEIRSMLSRYREGLKDGKQDSRDDAEDAVEPEPSKTTKDNR